MIPIFGQKKLNELNESDLQKLKDNQIRESRFIEYKEKEYGDSPEKVTKLLADISAFANSNGGYLFIGIEEESKENPIPKRINGIDNPQLEADKIRKRCESCIDEYIQGLEVHVILLRNNRGVVVVSIPNSPKKPHMITYKQKNRFYIRRDEGRSLMNVEEIRDTVLRVEDYMTKLSSFLENRKRELRSEILYRQYREPKPPWLILSASPIFVDQERLDVALNETIKDLMMIPPFKKENPTKLEESIKITTPKISLRGLRGEKFNQYLDYGKAQFLEVWNNGYIEFGFSLGPYQKKYLKGAGGFYDRDALRTFLIPNPEVPDLIVCFCFFIEKVMTLMNINEPVVIQLIIFESRDATLATADVPSFWHRDELIIEPLRFYTPLSASNIAYEIITKLFRAFGVKEPRYESLPGRWVSLFNENLEYKPDISST